jgi:hypothetical protein
MLNSLAPTAAEVSLERRERLARPMVNPFEARWLVEFELAFEIVAHAWHDQGMGIAGDDHGERAHARPIRRLTRQQRRIGPDLIEVFQDRDRLEQRAPAVIDERRDQHLRIDGAEVRLVLLPLHQIDVDDLGGKTLEVQRDADAERRQRTPEGIKLHDRMSSPSGLCRGS